MAKTKIGLIIMAMAAIVLFVSCQSQKSSDKKASTQAEIQKESAMQKPAPTLTPAAGTATIEYRYNVLLDGGENNYFYWSADGSDIHEDWFDVASGASKNQSTKLFNEVRFDETGKKKAIPMGLRHLMLTAIAAKSVPVGDKFTVTQDGKKLIVTFIHFGNAIKMTTDENGMVDTATSFEIASGLTEKINDKTVVKAEYLLAGADKSVLSNVDLNKVNFVPDVADSDASYKYVGQLATAYEDGILYIMGTLVKE